MQRIIRLEKELLNLNEKPLTNISIDPDFDKHEKENDIKIKAKIIGSVDTFYEGGLFELEIIIPQRYPFVSPKIKFLTPIYHPNIDLSGRICLDLLTQNKEWTPKYNLNYLLLQIQVLLSQPNFDDPLEPELASLFKLKPETFKKKAIEFTKLYAYGFKYSKN